MNDPKVVAYVKRFQRLVDHYQVGMGALDKKVRQGPRYGHFFIMPEDELIHLYEGAEGRHLFRVPPSFSMVMVYPKEGSIPRGACACIVQAHWVSAEQVEASMKWTEYIRQDEQQRAFMAAGFRPGTDIDLIYAESKIRSEFGLDPDEPKVVLNPSLTRPEVAAAIDANWEQVKRPGIVTLVIGTSDSMHGNRLRQAKDGVMRFLDATASNNQAGFLNFGTTIGARVEVAPIGVSKFKIAQAFENVRAGGQTALYDAIKTGVEMTDAAEGDKDAIRAVVVLTDGQADQGQTDLDDLIQMMSLSQVPIQEFTGMVGSSPIDSEGRTIDVEHVIGTRMALRTRHEVQIFFIGIGDADLNIGWLLAGATGAEFQASPEEDLAQVLEEFSKYF